MRLRDLGAELLVSKVPRQIVSQVATLAEAQGVWFECPGCQGHRVLVWFAGRGVPDEEQPSPRWQVSGTSLDDLTLHPSINLPGAGCGWHGWVKDGEAA